MRGKPPQLCQICTHVGARTPRGDGFVHIDCLPAGERRAIKAKYKARGKARSAGLPMPIELDLQARVVTIRPIAGPVRTRIAPGAPWPYPQQEAQCAA